MRFILFISISLGCAFLNKPALGKVDHGKPDGKNNPARRPIEPFNFNPENLNQTLSRRPPAEVLMGRLSYLFSDSCASGQDSKRGSLTEEFLKTIPTGAVQNAVNERLTSIVDEMEKRMSGKTHRALSNLRFQLQKVYPMTGVTTRHLLNLIGAGEPMPQSIREKQHIDFLNSLAGIARYWVKKNEEQIKVDRRKFALVSLLSTLERQMRSQPSTSVLVDMQKVAEEYCNAGIKKGFPSGMELDGAIKLESLVTERRIASVGP